VTTKGQITIPAELRRKYGLLPHAEVEVVEKDGHVVVRLKEGGMNRGRWIAEQLRGRLSGKATMTTDELMALTRGEDDGTFR
jgi:AbrB family looped-hinge helix DNA binding protein